MNRKETESKQAKQAKQTKTKITGIVSSKKGFVICDPSHVLNNCDHCDHCGEDCWEDYCEDCDEDCAYCDYYDECEHRMSLEDYAYGEYDESDGYYHNDPDDDDYEE